MSKECIKSIGGLFFLSLLPHTNTLVFIRLPLSDVPSYPSSFSSLVECMAEYLPHLLHPSSNTGSKEATTVNHSAASTFAMMNLGDSGEREGDQSPPESLSQLPQSSDGNEAEMLTSVSTLMEIAEEVEPPAPE
eukprot:TRINITY_DN11735_c0_g1_i1.p1 TRINITY_DN11735_c0_g1~~TRINITY_DN11735_c0_g1_i1.p1  ORF type:complete len:134 (+),score=26.95 TRINITY_DN11735_c0_g1_i1:166-567(+)